MDVVWLVLTILLSLVQLGLAGYWVFLACKTIKLIKNIMGVERKLAVMPTEDSVKERSRKSSKTRMSTSSRSVKRAHSPKTSRSKSNQSTKSSARTSKATSRASSKSSKSTSSRHAAGGASEIMPLTIRGTKPKIDREADKENFMEMLENAATFAKQYIDCPEKYPVTSDSLPGFLYQRLPTHPPAVSTPFDQIMDDFRKLIMTHYKHPRYLGQNVLSRSIPDILGEVIAVHIGSPGFIYDACPAVAEMQVAMLNWAGRALGIPEKFLFYANSETSQGGGSYQESIGDSTLCALMVARTYSTNQQFLLGGRIQPEENYLFAEATANSFQDHHKIYGQLCVYASSEAHPTVEKQCRIAMLRLRKITAHPENGYGMTALAVEKQIKKDMSHGRIPCCIIATLGTDGVLASDELGRIGRLGMKYNCWVHVMAHNVSSFWTEPKFRPCQEDLMYANSIQAQLPYHSNNMVVVWTRSQIIWKDGFKIFAQYLKPSKSFAIDERDWTIHLNRRFRGIKVWLNYRLIGLKRMREHANYICELTAYLEEKILFQENLRLFGSRVLNSFCFQYFEKGLSPADLATYTRLLGVYLNESHRLYLRTTTVGGAVVLSVSISYEGTTKQLLDELYDDLDQLVRQFRDHKDNPTLTRFPPEKEPPPSEVAVLPTTPLSLSTASVAATRTAQSSRDKVV